MPVGTSTRPPRAGKTASIRACKSMPASPACAGAGKGRSASSRLTGTSVGLRDSLVDGEFATPKTIEPNSQLAEVLCSAKTNRLLGVLVWMDLEMTGLDPATEVIVEIATLITDDELNVVAEGPDLVISQPETALAAMDPFVVQMHTNSGLLTAIKASTVTLEQAGAQTLEFIKKHVAEPRTIPLCGNSIGTDRRFLAKYLDQIELTTWCGALGSHWAERRTQIKCNGVVAIEAAALWVRVDFKTMKPVALSADLVALLETATGGRKVSSRLEIGKNLPDLDSNNATSQDWPIRFSDMDAVGHLNNAAYWEVLEEYLGANSGQRAPLYATVEHHGAIDPGNKVRIVTQQLEGRVVLRHVLADGEVAAVTELILA